MWMKEHNQQCTAPGGEMYIITEIATAVASIIWLETTKYAKNNINLEEIEKKSK